MALTILLHPKAAKELEKLEDALKTRVKERLKELKDNPETIGKALEPSDFWSPRIGDYHHVFEIDHAKKHVIVLSTGHKKKIYDDFSQML